MMRLAVALHTPPVASAIVISMSLLAFLLVFLLLLFACGLIAFRAAGTQSHIAPER